MSSEKSRSVDLCYARTHSPPPPPPPTHIHLSWNKIAVQNCSVSCYGLSNDTLWQSSVSNTSRATGMVQLVERPTEKPGAILTRIRIPDSARFLCCCCCFLPESTQLQTPLKVSAQLPCAIACINICAHVTNPEHWLPYHCLDTQDERTAHTDMNE